MQTHLWVEVILFSFFFSWGVLFVIAFVQADTVIFAVIGQIKYCIFCLYLQLMQYNRYPIT